MTSEKRVKHLRQVLLWPVYLLPLDEGAPMQDHWEQLEKPSPGNPWREIDDEFGDPCEFQARHYNEFVSFLPPVQRFLYGQGLGRSVSKVYGESPIRVMRRSDVTGARVVLNEGDAPVMLKIAHVDLYFFFDIDIALLAVEVCADDIAFETAQSLMFRFGRAYPAYWEEDGRGGHCPWKVEWLGADGGVLAASDYENREKFLSFVCRHRAPTTAAHWDFLLSPLVLHHTDVKGPVRYRQLEYYRMPYMAYLAVERAETLSRADSIRLALGNEAGEGALPYSDAYLSDFETRYCYDRNFTAGVGQGSGNVRFHASGDTLVVTGDASDRFYVDLENGVLSRFRHQHFLMFLIAHFQRAALLMFSDRLVAAVSRLEITNAKANRIFRREIRNAHENFLRFAHRYWFHNISHQAQIHELFDMTRRHLKLDDLYDEVREELQDMGNFLEVEATRKQNETVVRLTVVTTFGLVGTVTTGFIGMNLFDWTQEPTWWRVAAFLAVFVPTAFLTLYTVVKSRRLSEFLDALSDESVTWGRRWRALMRVWFGKSSM
ncbi:MAG: CorA family divalent cation transporter [Hyphomicrobium sp.]